MSTVDSTAAPPPAMEDDGYSSGMPKVLGAIKPDDTEWYKRFSCVLEIFKQDDDGNCIAEAQELLKEGGAGELPPVYEIALYIMIAFESPDWHEIERFIAFAEGRIYVARCLAAALKLTDDTLREALALAEQDIFLIKDNRWRCGSRPEGETQSADQYRTKFFDRGALHREISQKVAAHKAKKEAAMALKETGGVTEKEGVSFGHTRAASGV